MRNKECGGFFGEDGFFEKKNPKCRNFLGGQNCVFLTRAFSLKINI